MFGHHMSCHATIVRGALRDNPTIGVEDRTLHYLTMEQSYMTDYSRGLPNVVSTTT